MPKLTKRTVDALKPLQTGDVVVFDEELRGFGVRVKPSGHKSYLVQYRNAQGRSRRLTVGEHGRLTAEEARKEARQLLSAVERGADPSEERQRVLQAPTVAALADRYLEQHARPKKRTAGRDARMLEVYILPALGSKKVETITAADVAKLHHSLHDKPVVANRTLALLSIMFNLAEQW
nr:integrase arm-type DNA-binding domain-containing protein [Acidobacteriota bacterium]